MRLARLFLLPALLVAVPVFAVEPATMAEVCARAKCQHNVRITLKNKDGSIFDRVFEPGPPIVQPFGILVLAGQTVHVEADIVDGKLSNLVAVDKVADPARTITVIFEQTEDTGMMLTVKNPFTKVLKFDMDIMPLAQGRLVRTSSCAIGAGIYSFEIWPYPILQVVLGSGRLQEVSSTVRCEE